MQLYMLLQNCHPVYRVPESDMISKAQARHIKEELVANLCRAVVPPDGRNGIHIKEDATVEVRTPLKAPKSEIDCVVALKQKWIAEHLTIRKQRLESRAVLA